ncbi:MAG: hypothetical protein JW734_00775 [Candidatus Omnitrophica bacterium]|nr:hypothetical protein [Candidatus Omnitrophota bacterium]
MDVIVILVSLFVVSFLAGYYHFSNCKKLSDEILSNIKEGRWKREWKQP